MPYIDFRPAAALNELIGNADDALARPTPCRDTTLGDLIDHVDTFARPAHGHREQEDRTTRPHGRHRPTRGISARLAHPHPAASTTLAERGRNPEAWTGMTQGGRVPTCPGKSAGLVALNELVVHGWDVARASGQRVRARCRGARSRIPSCPSSPSLDRKPSRKASRSGRRGAGDAPLFDRRLGLTGRDPNPGSPGGR